MSGLSGEGAAGRTPVAFISHHSSQIEAARHLARVLERHGIKGWMAPDDIDPGMAFDTVIIDQISKCDVILLLFCARSDQSKHVKREIMLAEQSGKLIYPIRLETIQPEGLAYWLQDYQWIDWLDRRDGAIERMVETIRRRLSLPSEPQVAPAPPAASPPPAPAPVVAPPPVSAAQPPRGYVPVASEGAQKGPAFGFDTKAKVAVGAIGGLLVLAGLSALPGAESGDDGSGAQVAQVNAIAAPVPNQPAAPSYVSSSIEPGLWENAVQVRGFISNVPGLTADALGNVNRAAPTRDCISPQEAANPTQSLVDLARNMQGACTPAGMNFSGGYISGRLSCSQGASGVHAELDLGGTYTPSSINLDFAVVQSAQQNGRNFEAKYTLHMASRRVGDC